MPVSKEKMDRLRAYVKALNELAKHCTCKVVKARRSGGLTPRPLCRQRPLEPTDAVCPSGPVHSDLRSPVPCVTLSCDSAAPRRLIREGHRTTYAGERGEASEEAREQAPREPRPELTAAVAAFTAAPGAAPAAAAAAGSSAAAPSRATGLGQGLVARRPRGSPQRHDRASTTAAARRPAGTRESAVGGGPAAAPRQLPQLRGQIGPDRAR